MVGIIPLLIGQAGPGPPLGLLTIISAWAYSITTKTLLKTIYIIACLIGLYGGIASWSKISLLLIITGLIPWAILILSRPKKIKIILIILIFTIGFTLTNDSPILQIKDSVDEIISKKLSSEDHNLNNPDSKIWGERFVFHIAVLEIVVSHPLLGVGYAGFGNAYKETNASKALVIMLTNQGQLSDIEKAKSFGVGGYIIKATTIPSEVVGEVNRIYNLQKK